MIISLSPSFGHYSNLSLPSIRQESVGGLKFSGERRLTLKVLPLTAMQSKLADRVGILSVIFITVLVIILVMVIVTMVVLKRRRRPKTDRPQPEGVDLLKHVYTIQVTVSFL